MKKALNVKYLTICTYQHEPTLGSIYRHEYKNVWQPSSWGKIAEETMAEIQQVCRSVVVEDYVVMPNHIHILLLTKHVHPRMVHWFMSKCKQRLTDNMLRIHDSATPIWEKSFLSQNVYMERTHDALCQTLREHRKTWQYDVLYTKTFPLTH